MVQGRQLNIVAFPLLGDDDPLAAILDETGVSPEAVWVAGRRVFGDE